MLNATYTDPKNIPKDKIRFQVGDVDMDNPLVYDEEIEAALDTYTGNKVLAVVYRTMANRLALIGRRSLGPQTDDFGKSVEYLNAMADRYEKAQAVPTLGGGPAGAPIFTKGMHDYV